MDQNEGKLMKKFYLRMPVVAGLVLLMGASFISNASAGGGGDPSITTPMNGDKNLNGDVSVEGFYDDQNPDYDSVRITLGHVDSKSQMKVESNLTNPDLVKGTPFKFNWPTKNGENGSYSLCLTVYDSHGTVMYDGSQAPITVDVYNPENAKKAPSFTSPMNGDKNLNGDVSVEGVYDDQNPDYDTVKVMASHIDSKSQIKIESSLGDAAKGSPFKFNWETKLVENGSWDLRIVAYDANGKVAYDGEQDHITVNILNPENDKNVIVFTSPKDGAPVSGVVSIEGTYDDKNPNYSSVWCKVIYAGPNNRQATFNFGPYKVSPFKFNWDSRPNGEDGNWEIHASIFDANDKLVVDGAKHFITVNASNIENERNKPVASFTSHSNNDILKGSVNLMAVASDDVGVAKVRFLLERYNGSIEPIGEVPFNDPGLTYAFNWKSDAIVYEKVHIIAQAVDKAGNVSDYQNDPNARLSVTIDNASVDFKSDRVAVQVSCKPVKNIMKVSGVIWNPVFPGDPATGVDFIQFSAGTWQKQIAFDPKQNTYEADWNFGKEAVNGLYWVRMAAMANGGGQLGPRTLAFTEIYVPINNPPRPPMAFKVNNSPPGVVAASVANMDKFKMASITQPAKGGPPLNGNVTLKASIAQDIGATHAVFRYSCIGMAGPIGQPCHRA
jgi:hypothetical protein